MAKVSNRFLFQLHGWFSLPVWLIFCIVCLTGTIAVISHELTWLTNPASRALNPDALPEKTMPELISIVEKAYPTAKVSTAMNFEDYLVNAVIFTDTDKPVAVAYVNQYTGEIQEINQGMTFINFMRSLHAWLLFPWESNYSIGYYLVNLMAFVMLGALITGLLVYKKFWRSFTQPKLRVDQGKKTVLADLHKLAGVWSIWFLIVMSATGLWYLIQAVLWHADYTIEEHPPLAAISELPASSNKMTTEVATDSIPSISSAPPVSLANALEITKQKFPDFKSSYIMPIEHNRDTYKLYGEGDFIFYDKYAYGVTVNQWTGKIESVREPDEMTTLQTLSHIANPLHYGTIGGIWTKIIWFLFGVLLTGMSITGFMMWGGRTVRAARNTDVKSNEQEVV
ncbi:PepSY-associated TM helix domain-containing protein [Psychrosphaera saromensis]|uniref:Peptidase n=1 Tax=Psychrosphaera saromensis TaxID=716813 RepID=A0A2S7UTQ4_9GAMM|nr:PepSY-associated TM helix domain-containing protein [Psychrosphaera saromensis]PQJ53327.1 peptidase [Psychrosphaera saromensis]